MSSLVEIMAALADQLRDELDGVAGLEVYDLLEWNPTPPAIDIYPADPFQEPVAFGASQNALYLNIRARVNTPDHEGAQETLLDLMDPSSANSVTVAVESDTTLGGKVGDVSVTEGPSNYGIFTDPTGKGSFLGCVWTVTVAQ